MKTLKLFSSVFAMFLALILLVGCNVSQGYADKINKAAENKKHIEYSQVVKDLGKDNIIDGTIEVAGYRVGAVIGVKGLSDKEELEKRLDEGKEVDGIIVVIENGKAIKAEFRKVTKNDFKLFR